MNTVTARFNTTETNDRNVSRKEKQFMLLVAKPLRACIEYLTTGVFCHHSVFQTNMVRLKLSSITQRL